jgi:glutamyl-tRNA synthetase
MSVTVRFAPSPTGRLHVGNARVALVNWLFAVKQGGRFILRIDDTDVERSRAHFARAIVEDLQWLGLDWSFMEAQSARLSRYERAFGILRTSGRLYPCYETPEELAFKRKAQLARGAPPIYDRAALKLSPADRAALEAEGRKPHWRFRLEPGTIDWDDLIHGPWTLNAATISDPVLVKADGQPLFVLSSVVDDVEMAVTHVIRGDDHVTTTACQIQLAGLLGGAVPRFGHMPLLSDIGGEGLSKRTGSHSLGEMRAEGIEPMAVNSYLARLGTPDPIEPVEDLNVLIESFDISRIGRAPPRFDYAELKRLNTKLLAHLSFDRAAPHLRAMGLARADERFWLAVRGNLSRMEDARLWHDVVSGTVAPVIEDESFAGTAARLLPEGAWDESTWKSWTDAVKGETGRSGKALFKPLRLALTGAEHGPELKNLLPLIGRERALARLSGKTA